VKLPREIAKSLEWQAVQLQKVIVHDVHQESTVCRGGLSGLGVRDQQTPDEFGDPAGSRFWHLS